MEMNSFSHRKQNKVRNKILNKKLNLENADREIWIDISQYLHNLLCNSVNLLLLGISHVSCSFVL